MLISIITITLNAEKTILKTIRSINNQSFKNFEYIIIDGASTDQTINIIKKNLKKKYKIIVEKDNGIYDAMNKGIKISKGEFVGFLNSDDWLNKNTLKKIEKFIKINNPNIIFGNARFFKKNKFFFYAKANLDKIESDMTLLHSSFYVKNKIIKKYKFNENFIISSDYEQMIKLKKKYKFSFLNESLSNVSMGGISSNLIISSKEFLKIQKKYFGKLKAYKNYIKKYHVYLFKILLEKFRIF